VSGAIAAVGRFGCASCPAGGLRPVGKRTDIDSGLAGRLRSAEKRTDIDSGLGKEN